jgi:hypothetical protein
LKRDDIQEKFGKQYTIATILKIIEDYSDEFKAKAVKLLANLASNKTVSQIYTLNKGNIVLVR